MKPIDTSLNDHERAVVFGYAQFAETPEVARGLGVTEEEVESNVSEVIRKLLMGSLLCTLETDEPEDEKELATV